jgi:UDP-N-acetylglucosamine transferase subunit ALG13
MLLKSPKLTVTWLTPSFLAYQFYYSVIPSDTLSTLIKYSYFGVCPGSTIRQWRAKIMNSALVQIFNFDISPEIGNCEYRIIIRNCTEGNIIDLDHILAHCNIQKSGAAY